MVVLGGIGHLPGVILGAVLLAALPEVLRYVAGPLQSLTGGRLNASNAIDVPGPYVDELAALARDLGIEGGRPCLMRRP